MTLRKKVSAIIFNKDGDILLGKYCPDYKNRSKLGKTDKRTFPGGGKDTDEKFRDALYRELNEEINITSKNLDFVYSYKHPYYKRYESKTKKRFGTDRHTVINGKKQRFFVLFYNGKNKDPKCSNTNELCELKRVKLIDIEEYTDHKIIRFLNKEKLVKLIKKYLANRG